MVIPFMMFAVESSGVIAPRMMKLMSGDNDALHEAHLMTSEKVDAAFEATANLMAGASARRCNPPLPAACRSERDSTYGQA